MTAETAGPGPRPPRHAWAAVTSMAVGTFVMVTSEFLPIGLLGPIARDFEAAQGSAGLMVTIPGLVAAVAAPAVWIWSGTTDRRRLLIALTLLIAAADAIVALASSLAVVLIGRALLGVAVGGFWAFAAAAGRRMVPEADGGRATAVILGGISVGTVLGVPIGTLAGDLFGWRLAFGCVAAAALAVAAAQAAVVPAMRGDAAPGLSGVAALLRVRNVRLGFVAAAFIAAGHFSAYTYLEPFLSRGAGMHAAAITWTLAGYGVAGVIGTVLGERATSYDARLAFAAVALLIGAAMLAAGALASNAGASAALVVAWGLAFGAVPVCIQIWTYRSSPAHFEIGSALIVTVFQAALALGSFVGGIVVDAEGVRSAFLVGGGLAVTAGLILVRALGSGEAFE